MTEHEKQIRIRLRAAGNQLIKIVGDDKLEGYIEALGYDHSEQYVAQYENKKNKSTHEQEVYAESKFVQARKEEIERIYDTFVSSKEKIDDLYKKLVAAHKKLKGQEAAMEDIKEEEKAGNDRTDARNYYQGEMDKQQAIIDESLLMLEQDLNSIEPLLTKFEKLNDKNDLKEELDKYMESVKQRPEYLDKKAEEEAIREEGKREAQRQLEEQKAREEQAAKEAALKEEAKKKLEAEKDYEQEGFELDIATKNSGNPFFDISSNLVGRYNRYVDDNSKKDNKLKDAINAYKEVRLKQVTADIKNEKKATREKDAKSCEYPMKLGDNLVQKFFPENIPNLRERVGKFEEFDEYITHNHNLLDVDRNSTNIEDFSKMINVTNKLAKLHHQTPRPGFFSRLFNTSYNKAYNREQFILDHFKDKLSRLDSDYVEKITGRDTCNEELNKEEMLDAFYDMKKRERVPNDIMQVSQSDIRATVERDAKIALVDAVHNGKNPVETLNQYAKDHSASENENQKDQIVVEEANTLNAQSKDNVKVKESPTKVVENQREM